MLVILADDLTGAIDSASPIAGRGLRTSIALTREAIGNVLSEAPEVLAINVNSRDLMPEQAREETREVLRQLPQQARLFKKIDSRLKGNIAAELDAMCFQQALLAPAIPEFGRLVRKRRVEGFGLEAPLEIDPVLKQHACRTLVPDVSSQEDMAALLDATEARNCDLLIGARGLADALARQMTAGTPLKTVAPKNGPLLIVIGSRDPITLRQIDHLRSGMEITYVAAPGGIAEPLAASSARVTLVHATEAERPMDAAQVAANLAATAVPRFTDGAGTLLLSGGATAQAVLSKMGIAQLQLLGECRPGLGVAYAAARYLITKSGGFGEPETLTAVARDLLETFS